jgi:DNA-binding response OmpR family regulator
MKILIAGDSPTVRHLVAVRLRADGSEVLEASDGEEALALARARHPDLLVLDKVMPKIDGFEVARAIRGDPQTRAVPIVMLTEQAATAEPRLGSLQLGVEEYMPKPFSPHELSVLVRSALARTESRIVVDM